MQEIEHGIVRNSADDGWFVIPVKNGQSPNVFYDVTYGNSHRSYDEAQKHNAVLRPYKDGFRNHQIPPRSKRHSVLPVGITLSTRVLRNKGGKGTQLIYNFKVCRIQARPTTVYIGTAITWEHNYEAALRKAIDIRESSKQSAIKVKT
jgi:hypothetical protein